jgi:hypothetical protein
MIDLTYDFSHPDNPYPWRMACDLGIILTIGLINIFTIKKEENGLIWRMAFHTPDGSYPWRMARDLGTILILKR